MYDITFVVRKLANNGYGGLLLSQYLLDNNGCFFQPILAPFFVSLLVIFMNEHEYHHY